jgi:hypothetical protein
MSGYHGACWSEVNSERLPSAQSGRERSTGAAGPGMKVMRKCWLACYNYVYSSVPLWEGWDLTSNFLVVIVYIIVSYKSLQR